MAAPRAVPRLASDVFRGYVSLALGIALSMPVPFVLKAVNDSTSFIVLLAATYLIGWAIVSLFSTGLTVLVFARATGEQLAEWLEATTPHTARTRFWYFFNGGGAANWAISGSFVAIASVLALSFSPVLKSEPLLVVAGIAVVAGSLLVTISAYAVSYAREQSDVGGLAFTKTPAPTYADYLYLAVQVGTTFSSADVSIESTRMRRLVTANSLISFTFNTVVIALLVSLLVTTAS